MTEVGGDPRFIARRDMRQSWELPFASTIGTMRSIYDGMRAGNCQVNLVSIGIGQLSPMHSNTIDCIFFQLEGEIELGNADVRWHLRPYDMLYIPPNYAYEYYNIGDSTALYLSVVSKVDLWPPQSTFADGQVY